MVLIGPFWEKSAIKGQVIFVNLVIGRVVGEFGFTDQTGNMYI